METVLITGGTGMLGSAITRLLVEKGFNVIILTRRKPVNAQAPNINYAIWDVANQQIDVQAVQRADYIIHLAGAGVVDKKWTNAYKKQIQESRTGSSRLLVDTLRHHSHSVKAIISASAIGWYGPDPVAWSDPKKQQAGFIETADADKSFLGETCRLWEESIAAVSELHIRLVKFRIGIVLSNDGGAFVEFKKPLRFGIAAILGTGRQVVSWIHIDDLSRLFLYAISNEQMVGVYNAVAPIPASNRELTLQLARALRGKFFIPLFVPAFVLKIMMGQRSIEVLKSATVSNQKISNHGFVFLYPSITAAIGALVPAKSK